MIFWLIQFIPLAATAAILLLLRRKHGLAAAVSVSSALACAALSLYAVFNGVQPSGRPNIWLEIGLFQLEFGFTFDRLAQLMLLVVTGVGAIIHVFSIGYMAGDRGTGRYFGFLSLFMFSMTGIVLANNFVQMFIFWELVGLSSYLLIGFWFERDSAAQAGKKAFLTNKLGDFGFMLGILAVWAMAGTFNFQELAAVKAWKPAVFDSVTLTVTLAALLIFCGAVGKSAQFPLHVWLPDAMEGPTPVSALIHAATMVAAGVYMLARVHFLIAAAPAAMDVIASIGAVTACMAALIATQQNDIKRILAYSTLSQLGYMVMVTGVAGFDGSTPAMFHLTTHAFFKALLFLGAGSIIIALHHEQDIWKMGGLSGKMGITFVTFFVGMLALVGCPGFSGFFSKEMILNALYENNRLLFAIGLFTAFLTAFYMTRLMVVVFFGLPRGEAAMHAVESPLVMTAPLLVLAVLSLVGGTDRFGILNFLPRVEVHHEPRVVFGSIAALAAGFSLATVLYWNRIGEPLPLTALRRKLYFDEVYEFLVRNVQGTFAALLGFLDRWVLDFALFRGLAALLRAIGWGLRHLQTGSVQTYTFLFGLGTALLIGWILWN